MVIMNKLTKLAVAFMGAATMVGCCSNECAEKECEQCACDRESAVVENIMTRRSVRDYKAEPVDRDQMATIIECGIYAPSAMNMQAWAVRVVDAPDFIDGVTAIAVEQNPQLKEQPNFRNFFRNAPTVAFIAVPDESYSGEFDSGLLAENMMLSAQSLGVGSVCLGSPVRFILTSPDKDKVLSELGFSEGYELCLCIAFGYADEAPAAKPRDINKVRFVE